MPMARDPLARRRRLERLAERARHRAPRSPPDRARPRRAADRSAANSRYPRARTVRAASTTSTVVPGRPLIDGEDRGRASRPRRTATRPRPAGVLGRESASPRRAPSRCSTSRATMWNERSSHSRSMTSLPRLPVSSSESSIGTVWSCRPCTTSAGVADRRQVGAHHVHEIEQASSAAIGKRAQPGVRRTRIAGIGDVRAGELGDRRRRVRAEVDRQPRQRADPAHLDRPQAQRRRHHDQRGDALGVEARQAQRQQAAHREAADGDRAGRRCGASSRASAASADASQSRQLRRRQVGAACRRGPPACGASTEQPRRPKCSASGRTSNGVPVMPCRQSTPRPSPAMRRAATCCRGAGPEKKR